MTAPVRSHPDPWTAFGLGVLGGVIGGLSLLSFAGIFAVALVAILGGVAVHPRPFGAAGVFLGWAVTWTVVLAAAQARCDPASCVAPDLTVWVGMALAIAAVGTALLLVGIRRPSWADSVSTCGRGVARHAAVRWASAIVLGAIAGVFAASLVWPGLTTTALIVVWFAARRRAPGRRVEIAWFALAAIGAFGLLLPR